LDCSYGFRPKRSAHEAVEQIWQQVMRMGGCWLLEVDIKSYFDTIAHGQLRNLFTKRVCDGVIVRLLGKWLNAGVMEDGAIHRTREGTPQGGVISPLLANIYLHEVVDGWFEEQVKPRLQGPAFLVRYADDMVMGFVSEHDARKVLEVLPKRFGKYGLSLHPEKTRLVDFRRPPGKPGAGRGGKGGRETFDFLGFTHYWGKSRRGNWVVTRKTAKDRYARSLRRVSEWCRRFRHKRVKVQHRQLSAKMQGHYGYYGITGNYGALARFRSQVERVWRKWLDRRSQKRRMPWSRFKQLLTRYPLPRPRVVHTVMP